MAKKTSRAEPAAAKKTSRAKTSRAKAPPRPLVRPELAPPKRAAGYVPPRAAGTMEERLRALQDRDVAALKRHHAVLAKGRMRRTIALKKGRGEPLNKREQRLDAIRMGNVEAEELQAALVIAAQSRTAAGQRTASDSSAAVVVTGLDRTVEDRAMDDVRDERPGHVEATPEAVREFRAALAKWERALAAGELSFDQQRQPPELAQFVVKDLRGTQAARKRSLKGVRGSPEEKWQGAVKGTDPFVKRAPPSLAPEVAFPVPKQGGVVRVVDLKRYRKSAPLGAEAAGAIREAFARGGPEIDASIARDDERIVAALLADVTPLPEFIELERRLRLQIGTDDNGRLPEKEMKVLIALRELMARGKKRLADVVDFAVRYRNTKIVRGLETLSARGEALSVDERRMLAGKLAPSNHPPDVGEIARAARKLDATAKKAIAAKFAAAVRQKFDVRKFKDPETGLNRIERTPRLEVMTAGMTPTTQKVLDEGIATEWAGSAAHTGALARMDVTKVSATPDTWGKKVRSANAMVGAVENRAHWEREFNKLVARYGTYPKRLRAMTKSQAREKVPGPINAPLDLEAIWWLMAEFGFPMPEHRPLHLPAMGLRAWAADPARRREFAKMKARPEQDDES